MSSEEHRLLSTAEIKAIADEAAKEAVNRTLKELGLDALEPIEAQADMRFLRQLRRGVDAAAMKIGMTIIGLIAAAMLGAMAMGMLTWINQSGKQ